jgi:putative two-component system response regulator
VEKGWLPVKVFIIADDDLSRRQLADIAGTLVVHSRIESFDHGLRALARAQVATPDLIIIDLKQPDASATDLVAKFRALPAVEDVPVVVLIAASEARVRQRALAAGANDIISRPFLDEEIKARLRNLLDMRRAHLRLQDQNTLLSWSVDHATQKILAREEELIIRLSRAAEFRDAETGAHILRMAHYSRMIASQLAMDAEDCALIFRAAPMHDLGKLGIPDHILLKPGRLDDGELSIMRTHAQIGFDILDGSSAPLVKLGSVIARSHHEKYDGSGYPDGAIGDAIPLPGRIVAVSDVFDALTSERPYKKAWSLVEARDYLSTHRGSHFDPVCVDAFLADWSAIVDIHTRFSDATAPKL